MESAGALALAALLFLLGMVAWFTIAARTHFSKDSPRRPILFALEGLSLAITVGTAIVVSSAPAIPPLRSLASMVLGAAAGMLFSSPTLSSRADRIDSSGILSTLPISSTGRDAPH